MRRLRGAVPPSGITGATFVGERMFVAGQGGGPFRVWSIDLATGARRLEIERRIVGESEGLVTASLKGGTLSWLIQPFTDEQKPPTYSPDKATLLSFRARPAAGAAAPRLLRALAASTVLRRDGFAAAVRCPDGCTASLRVAPRRRRAGPDDQARAAVEPARGARARPPHRPRPAASCARSRGRLRLTFRATVREPSGTVTRRSARVRLR